MSNPNLDPPRDTVVLYQCPGHCAMPAGAVPAPRADLLEPRGAYKVACWLALFFRTVPKRLCTRGRTPRYPISFLADRAVINVELDLLRAPGCTVPSLVSSAPQINQWLLAWSESTGHRPDIEASWAKTMGLDAATVHLIAAGVATSIAQPEESAITICDGERRSCTFRIPPRAKLQAHAQSRGDEPEYVQVCRVEDLLTARTPGGDKILLTGVAKTQPGSKYVTLQPAAFRRNQVCVSKKFSVRSQTQLPTKERKRK